MLRKIVIALVATAVIAFVPAGASARGGFGGGGFHGGGFHGGGFGGGGWRGGKQEAQWRQSLTAYAYPTIGELPVQAIDVGLVMKVLEPIWNREAGDGQPGPGSDRKRARLGDGPRLSLRRKPGQMARPPR